jgi:L-ascorbate metabolism protein UlaG (beta-lactamase superfamily)
MRVTKFVHSCLLVETADRTVLFDPGAMTEGLDPGNLSRLDDIFITHIHGDHMDISLIKQLLAKFPTARITSTNEVVQALAAEGVKATTTPPAGVELFESPHENVKPVFPQPENTGFHYLDSLTDPGDSHSFSETKAVLALPITAPWGAHIRAINLALELKPKHVLPIHDWHWSDAARQGSYDAAERILGEQGITFHKLQTGQPVELAT